MNRPGKLYLVVPCYNEETILSDSVRQLTGALENMIGDSLIGPQSRILLVDDGSKDGTWNLIGQLSATNQFVIGLKLAHNVGHQYALVAGLQQSLKERADLTISLDADLQDDISVLPQFVRDYHEGNEIVYGVRADRSSDSFFKRTTATGFYRILHLFGVQVIYNHADFRLMSRRALEALSEYRESNLYLRGIVPLIGFRQSVVSYRRKATDRPTHYPLHKMLLLALDGITSFSIRPIRLITLLGFFMFSFSMVMLLYYLGVKLFGYSVRGWASQVFISLLLGGVQLFCLGVIGEYIGKIYTEVKHRPRFIIESRREGDHNAD